MLSDGTKVIFNSFYQCDCGSTGGCEKCQPFVYTPEMQREDIKLAELGMKEYYEGLEWIDKNEFIIPTAREERFLDKELKEFYKKKGYKLD